MESPIEAVKSSISTDSILTEEAPYAFTIEPSSSDKSWIFEKAKVISYLAPAIRDNFPLKIRLAMFKLFTEIESDASIRVPLPFRREVESEMDYRTRDELDLNRLNEPSTFEMK